MGGTQPAYAATWPNGWVTLKKPLLFRPFTVTGPAVIATFNPGPLAKGPDGHIWFADPLAGIGVAGTIGKIDITTMREANLRAAGGDAAASPDAIARWLWQKVGEH